MKILSPFEPTVLSATKPGDLIRITAHPQAPFGLIVHEADGKSVVGILQNDAAARPYHIVFQRDFACLRYNDGWVLELPKEDAVYGRADLAGAAGVIHVGKTGVVLNLAANEPRYNELTVNLHTFEWDNVQPHAVAFPHWKVWASEADAARSGAKPIFEFTYAN